MYRHLEYVKAYVDGSVINGKWGGGYAIFTPDNKLIYTDCGMGANIPELNEMIEIIRIELVIFIIL